MSRNRRFFIGHREASGDLLPALRAAIEQHIVEYGETEFLAGKYGGFDRLAAQCVLRQSKTIQGSHSRCCGPIATDARCLWCY